jgi:hypothetical protein
MWHMWRRRETAYRVLAEKRGGKRQLGRPRITHEDNIEMDLKVMGSEDVGWINWAQDEKKCRDIVNTVMNLRFSF